MLQSGVHATVAGVLLAMTIPARTLMDERAFVARGRELLDRLERAGGEGRSILTNSEQQSALGALETSSARVTAPLQRIEHALHPWVLFGVMPVFALANAGVALDGDLGSAFADRVTIGIILGLVVGKQVGVTLFAWLATRIGLASLPADVSWRQIYGAGWLTGIGFTMSLFIADLAFAAPELLTSAKIGILSALLLAGAVGVLLLRRPAPALAASSAVSETGEPASVPPNE